MVARRDAGDPQSSALSSFWSQRIRSGATQFATRAAKALELRKNLAGYVERFPTTQSSTRLRATAATHFCSYLRRHLHYPAVHLEVLQATCSSSAPGAS